MVPVVAVLITGATFLLCISIAFFYGIYLGQKQWGPEQKRLHAEYQACIDQATKESRMHHSHGYEQAVQDKRDEMLRYHQQLEQTAGEHWKNTVSALVHLQQLTMRYHAWQTPKLVRGEHVDLRLVPEIDIRRALERMIADIKPAEHRLAVVSLFVDDPRFPPSWSLAVTPGMTPTSIAHTLGAHLPTESNPPKKGLLIVLFAHPKLPDPIFEVQRAPFIVPMPVFQTPEKIAEDEVEALTALWAVRFTDPQALAKDLDVPVSAAPPPDKPKLIHPIPL